MYDDYGADRFAPLAINLWEDMNSVVKVFARQYTYQFLRDAGTVWNIYKINSYIPLNYVIDTAGIVLYGTEGFNEAVIRAYIESALPPTGLAEHPRPAELQIAGVTPNPARQTLTLSFTAPRTGDVSLRIYSSSGKLIRTLFSGSARTDLNTAQWNLCDDAGNRVSSGMYFCELNGGSKIIRAKFTVI